MRVIQHDTQSLRHNAIERYVRTRDRIDRNLRHAVARSILILVAILAIAGLMLLAAHHAR